MRSPSRWSWRVLCSQRAEHVHSWMENDSLSRHNYLLRESEYPRQEKRLMSRKYPCNAARPREGIAVARTNRRVARQVRRNSHIRFDVSVESALPRLDHEVLIAHFRAGRWCYYVHYCRDATRPKLIFCWDEIRHSPKSSTWPRTPAALGPHWRSTRWCPRIESAVFTQSELSSGHEKAPQNDAGSARSADFGGRMRLALPQVQSRQVEKAGLRQLAGTRRRRRPVRPNREPHYPSVSTSCRTGNDEIL